MRKKIGNRDGEVNMKWREDGEERRVDREREIIGSPRIREKVEKKIIERRERK